MAPYATPDEYRALCPDAAGGKDDAGLARELSLASDAVDGLCFGRIRRAGFEELTAFQQERVRRATCLHAAYTAGQGSLSGGLTSYTVGEVRAEFDTAALETLGGVTTTCTVLAQLRQAGLALRLVP